MNEFKFSGDWETWIRLNWFSKIDLDTFYFQDIIQEKIKDKLIKLIIESDLSDNPDPTVEQFNAINLFLSEEKQIYKRVLDEIAKHYEKIKPRYLEDFGEEFIDELFPSLDSVDNLDKIIALNDINLTLLNESDFAFIKLYFSCRWDEEHGFSIVVHKDKIVQFNAGYDYDLEVLLEDSSQYIEYRKLFDIHLYSPEKYFYLNPKYNKLKPAQIEASRSYPFGLIEYGKNEEFIKGIESNLFSVNVAGTYSLIATTCIHTNKELFDYILSKKPINTTNSIECCIYHTNFEFLDKLLDYGVNINENHYTFGTPLRKCMLELLNSRNNERTAKFKMGIEYLIRKGADPKIKDLMYNQDIFELIENHITQNKEVALECLIV